MLDRILEPEVMDTREEAVDYDSMDHSEVNRVFVDDFLASAAFLDHSLTLKILDTGTGTALIPIELCSRQMIDCHVDAVDLSSAMLQVGKHNVDAEGLDDRVVLIHADCKAMPMEDNAYDAVMSNSIVHHIPEPAHVFAEMVRVLRPGGVLFVRDLMRPADVDTVARLVETYAGDENDHQRQMFRDSLHAALTVDEVQAILASLALPSDWVRQNSDRHWTVSGRLPG